jgi:hypothetical protein
MFIIRSQDLIWLAAKCDVIISGATVKNIFWQAGAARSAQGLTSGHHLTGAISI